MPHYWQDHPTFYDPTYFHHDAHYSRPCQSRSRSHLPHHQLPWSDRETRNWNSPRLSTIRSSNSLSPAPPAHTVARLGRAISTTATHLPPMMSFEAAVPKLEATVTTAIDFFTKFYADFRKETAGLKYAGSDLIDQIWMQKVLESDKNPGKPSGGNNNNNNNTNSGRGQTNNNNHPRDTHTFSELQSELSLRCRQIYHLDLPNFPTHTPDQREKKNSADKFMSKITTCIDDLMPAVGRMDQSGAETNSAIQEMQIIRASLKTYRKGWERAGGQGEHDGGQGQDQNTDDGGVGGERENKWG